MGVDEQGFGTDLSKIYSYNGGNPHGGPYQPQLDNNGILGGYDVGAGNLLLIDVESNFHTLALTTEQPVQLGFYIIWNGSPRKSNPPDDDPGPGYEGPSPAYPIPRGQYGGSAFGGFNGMMGSLLQNAYASAPPAGVRAYDWHWPLFRIPVNNEPGIPVLPWSDQPGSPLPKPQNHFLFLIPAPMDYARVRLWINPSPFTPLTPGLVVFNIKAAAITGCQGFGGLIQRP
jgi:hypothetical protein